MILLIDNYDSFTYNLYQYIGELYQDIQVVRNDEITLDEIEKLSPQALIISPGPGYPKDAGISVEAIKHFSGKLPILGICLGHQSICEAFGGTIIPAKELMHGKSSNIKIDTSSAIFKGLPETIVSARYHSLIADSSSIPDCLKVTGTDSAGQIMAVEHKEHSTYGLQFHPESVLTGYGKIIIKNFLLQIKDIKQFMSWCMEGSSTYTKRKELFENQKKQVEAEITKLNKTLDMLNFKCWYYSEAIKDGNEERLKNIIPNKLPNSIKSAYMNSHKE